jgi:plastocyanin
MPAGLVKGDDARDVAAYVGQAVAEPGDDPGRLAAVGASKAEGTAEEQNGTLDIPVAASGLAYKFADATANAGQVTIKSENPQSTPHDIAVEGKGLNDKGEVVTDGGVSEFQADLTPGEYTFFCSVPGHREGGMEGKLTVK